MGWLVSHWSPLDMHPTATKPFTGRGRKLTQRKVASFTSLIHFRCSIQLAFSTNIFLISPGFTSGARISLPRVLTSLLRCPCPRVTGHYGNPHAGPLPREAYPGDVLAVHRSRTNAGIYVIADGVIVQVAEIVIRSKGAALPVFVASLSNSIQGCPQSCDVVPGDPRVLQVAYS